MKHCPRAVSIARPSTLQLTALPSELAAAPRYLEYTLLITTYQIPKHIKVLMGCRQKLRVALVMLHLFKCILAYWEHKVSVTFVRLLLILILTEVSGADFSQSTLIWWVHEEYLCLQICHLCPCYPISIVVNHYHKLHNVNTFKVCLSTDKMLRSWRLCH